MMTQFLTGDELGNIKALKYSFLSSNKDSKVTTTTLYDGNGKGKERAVQKMTVWTSEDGPLVAVARADGSTSVSRLQTEGLELIHEWTEPRLKVGNRYIGLAASSSRVFSCTSNGALRLTQSRGPDAETQTAALPMRLCDWRLAPEGNYFSYAGDEVELSIWDLESAFAPKQTAQASSQHESDRKRKRGNELLPGELWRAKNVANDNLSLRQPVHNTCLTYLSTPQQLLAGTQRGDVRRYDSRATRKPVAEWKQIAKGNGIGHVEKGCYEHEIFISDQTSNLFAIDARNGRIIYGYKGIAGAVTSMAPTPAGLVSTALDRYARVHSTYPPPSEPGQPQDDKGVVLEKVYMKSIPTCVVWDEVTDRDADHDDGTRRDRDDGDEDVWEGMQVTEDSGDGSETRARRRRKDPK